MADAASDIRVERKPKLSERVVTALRSQVLSGEISPGQKLPTENQLTETFGVSRTVIREAIATLAADGLVEPRQGAGVFVRDHPTLAFGSISLDIGNKISQAINVLEVRMGIEIESAGLAALRRNSAQEAEIQEAFFEFERLLALDQATGKTDFAFHRAIAAATNNPFYVEVLDALGARTIPCDITSPWGTESVLDARIPGRAAARASRHPRTRSPPAIRRPRAMPCASISPPARSAIAGVCAASRRNILPASARPSPDQTA